MEIRYLFIPKPFDAQEHPAWQYFPQNILLLCKQIEEKIQYLEFLPMPTSYRQDQWFSELQYSDRVNAQLTVAVRYYPKDAHWEAEVCRQGESIGYAFGEECDKVFRYLGMLLVKRGGGVG